MLFGSGRTGTPKILLLMFVGRPTRVSCSVRLARSLARSLLGTRDRILNGPKTDTHKSRKASRRWRLVDAGAPFGKPLFLSRAHTYTHTYIHIQRKREGSTPHLDTPRLGIVTHIDISYVLASPCRCHPPANRSNVSKAFLHQSFKETPRTSGEKKREGGREGK